ncbi:MAG: peptidase, partial [Paenibacillus sp.]|nr:peptidase [Paenibacillus sp.]
MGVVLSLVIIFIVIVIAALSIKIVPQQRVGVVERLGKFNRLLTPGVNILVPIIDHVRKYHDLRIQQANV